MIAGRWPSFPLFSRANGAISADDVRQLFDELAQGRPAGPSVAGTCRPLVDVFETDEVIELVVDAAGVPAASLRVLFRQGVVVVAGEKTAQPRPTR